MTPSERMLQLGCRELRRVHGNPFDIMWVGFGTNEFFSMRDVNADHQLIRNGDVVKIDPSVLKSLKHESRVLAAQKAAKTRAAPPPSRSAVNFLAEIGESWIEPRFWSDADLLKELFRKGLVFWAEFKTPAGTRRRYHISGRGREYLVSRGLAEYADNL